MISLKKYLFTFLLITPCSSTLCVEGEKETWSKELIAKFYYLELCNKEIEKIKLAKKEGLFSEIEQIYAIGGKTPPHQDSYMSKKELGEVISGLGFLFLNLLLVLKWNDSTIVLVPRFLLIVFLMAVIFGLQSSQNSNLFNRDHHFREIFLLTDTGCIVISTQHNGKKNLLFVSYEDIKSVEVVLVREYFNYDFALNILYVKNSYSDKVHISLNSVADIESFEALKIFLQKKVKKSHQLAKSRKKKVNIPRNLDVKDL